MVNNLEQDGYSIVHGVLNTDQLAELLKSIKPLLKTNPPAGIRNLVTKVPHVHILSESKTVRALVEPVLGADARLIRSILFNKSQESNWQVAWHQDLAIAVKNLSDIAGFTSWSLKEGVHHVQPPVAILEKMLTVRLHLDAADENNGALWVSPGSHRFGRIPASEAVAIAERTGKKLCAVQAGDALLLRPLVLHASRKAVSNNSRRVIHLEFTGVELPKPLAWHDAA